MGEGRSMCVSMGLPVCKLVYLPFVVWRINLHGVFIMVVR